MIKKRIKHLPSTLMGIGLIFIGIICGVKYGKWEITSGLIPTGIGLIGYLPKTRNENDKNF